MFMFSLILISAVTIMHAYVLWRAGSVPFLRQRVTRKMLVTAGLALWILFVVGRLYGHDSPGLLALVLEFAGMTWMIVVFLISAPMLVVDAITLFGRLMPRAALRMRGAAIVIGVVLSVIAMVQGTRQPLVEDYEVLLPGLPPKLDNTVIVGLSDMHLGSLRNEQWLRARVSQVQAEHPDIIVLLGDIFEGHNQPPKTFVTELQGLKAPMGVWAVLGNHEFHGDDDDIVPLFQEAGITVLRNEKAVILPGLVLAGVDDLTFNRRMGSKVDLITRALAKPLSGATVLLSHTPWHADLAAKAGAGLMLCGHTHGGQVWPFGYFVRIIYPLLAGQYDVEGMAVIVSRGAGLWGPPMRLWKPGEIIRVTLRAIKKEV
jgi:predicted MPP superfamily phosphohydrolase